MHRGCQRHHEGAHVISYGEEGSECRDNIHGEGDDVGDPDAQAAGILFSDRPTHASVVGQTLYGVDQGVEMKGACR